MQQISVSAVKTRKRVIAVIVLLAAVALSVALFVKVRSAVPRKDTKVVLGRPLPNLPVTDPLGSKVDLATIAAGKKRVIAFYSPSCDACQKELPELHPFPENLELVMIKDGTATASDAWTGAMAGGVRYTDNDRILNQAFAMPTLPTLLFVDENGTVRDGLIGVHPPEVTRGKLQKFAQSRT
jgi:thiol-disulfide isomerase/thioredoxin